MFIAIVRERVTVSNNPATGKNMQVQRQKRRGAKASQRQNKKYCD